MAENKKWSQKELVNSWTSAARICMLDGTPLDNKTLLISDLLSGTGGTGSTLELIKSGDTTLALDTNAFSALRVSNEFLNKKADDVATGKYTVQKGVQTGVNFASGASGSGAFIDAEGNGEFESLKLRSFLEAPEYRYNRVKITVGDDWRSPGGGVIESVDTVNKIITLKLEDKEFGEIAVDDKCMGVFHSVNSNDNESFSSDDSKGNKTFSGFVTVYFKVVEILDTVRNSQFRYELRPTSENWGKQIDPYPMMNFVVYANPTDTSRQTSKYSTRSYERYLKGMTDWEISVNNIAAQFGDLTNLTIHNLEMSGYSAYLNNIYMSGTIQQISEIDPITLKYSSVEVPGNPTDNPDNWTDVSDINTIWMAIQTIKEGIPTAWSIVRTKGEPGDGGGISGQSTFKSTAFIRTNTAPAEPSGGSYESPVPTTAGWSDGVPSGVMKLWMSTRIFTSDGLSPQQSTWMPPVSLTDNASLEVMFSSVATNPGTPTTSPANWTTTGDTSSIWMTTRTITNGTAGTWTIAKIKGESGNDAFVVASTRDYIGIACNSSGTPKTGELGASGTTLFTLDVYQGNTKLAFATNWAFYNNEYTDVAIGQVSGTSTLYVSSIAANSGYVTFGVRIYATSTHPQIILYKRVNVSKLYDGANGANGVDGVDGISVVLTNDSHSIICDSSGTPLTGELGSSGKAVTEVKVYMGGTLKTYGTDWQFLTHTNNNVTSGQIAGQPKIYINSMSQEAKSGYVDINLQLLGVSLTKRFSVTKSITGIQGLEGMLIRTTQWAKDFEYHNDQAITSGSRFLDVVSLKIAGVNKLFKCKLTHVSSLSNTPPNNIYWEAFNTMAPLYTSLILAANGVIDFLQGNQLLMQKSDGTVTAGLSGADGTEGLPGVRIWAGGPTPGAAPFRVNELGDVFANSGKFMGSFATPFSEAYINSTGSINLSFAIGFNFIFSPAVYTSLNVYLPSDLSYSGTDCWLCHPYISQSVGSVYVRVVGGGAQIAVPNSNSSIPTMMEAIQLVWLKHLKAIPLNGVLYWFVIE